MLQLIIFDMDWVLLDSPVYIEQSFHKLFQEKYGIDISWSDRKRYLWRALKEQIPMYSEEYNINIDLTPEEFSTLAFSYELELYKSHLQKNIDVISLIESAHQNNIKVAVATSSTHKRAETILSVLGIDDLLDAFITIEDVEHGKPAPDLFLKAAEILWIAPIASVVIEDAINGIQAATAANMKSIWKITDYHTQEEFLEAGAKLTFSQFNTLSLSDLQNIF